MNISAQKSIIFQLMGQFDWDFGDIAKFAGHARVNSNVDLLTRTVGTQPK